MQIASVTSARAASMMGAQMPAMSMLAAARMGAARMLQDGCTTATRCLCLRPTSC